MTRKSAPIRVEEQGAWLVLGIFTGSSIGPLLRVRTLETGLSGAPSHMAPPSPRGSGPSPVSETALAPMSVPF